MLTPEGKVKAEVKKYLKDLGAYYFMPVQTGYGAAGVDFYICYKGWFIAVETKAGEAVPKLRQRKVLEDVDSCGGIALCINNVKSLQRYIEGLNARRKRA